MLCNKDSGCYENAWRLYKAKHLSIVTCKQECKKEIQYNKFSSFPFSPSLPLCCKSVSLFHCEWCECLVSVRVRRNFFNNGIRVFRKWCS